MNRIQPDEDTTYAGALLRAFMRDHELAGPKPTAHGTRFRFSDVGTCARQIGYHIATNPHRGSGRGKGVKFQDEQAAIGIWTTSLGSIIHQLYQDALEQEMDHMDFDTEVKGLLHDTQGRPLISGSADVIIREPNTGDLVASVEVKTRNGTRYRKAVASEGPSYEAILQGGINALAQLQGDEPAEVVVVYLSLENTTENRAASEGIDFRRRVVAQWTYPRAEWEPLARAELARIEEIDKLLDSGFLPERKIPAPNIPRQAVIDNPKTGHWGVEGWRKGGTTWQCHYCPFQQRCIEDGPGEVYVKGLSR